MSASRGGLGGGDRDGAGGEDLDDERDLRGVAGAGDRARGSPRRGESGEHGADLAGAEDADRRSLSDGRQPSPARMSRTMGITLRAVQLDGAQAGATGWAPAV